MVPTLTAVRLIFPLRTRGADGAPAGGRAGPHTDEGSADHSAPSTWPHLKAARGRQSHVPSGTRAQPPGCGTIAYSSATMPLFS